MSTLEDRVVRTGKDAVNVRLAIIERVHQVSDGRPQARRGHEAGHDDDEDVGDGEGDLGRGAQEATLVKEEPEDGTDSEGKPGNEGGGGDVEDRLKDGNGVGQEEGQDPEDGGGTAPDGHGLGGAVGHLVGGLDGAHDDHVEVLDGRVAKDETGAEEGGDGDAVRDLGGQLGGGTQSRRGDVLAGKAVYGNGDHEVHGDGEGLEGDEPGNEVLGRVLHLGHVADCCRELLAFCRLL